MFTSIFQKCKNSIHFSTHGWKANHEFWFFRCQHESNQRDIAEFPEIEQAVIFGSRAMGNYRKGSDIDIAIMGQNINQHTITRLSALLNEELPLPWFFDIVDFTHLPHPELARHIREHGKRII